MRIARSILVSLTLILLLAAVWLLLTGSSLGASSNGRTSGLSAHLPVVLGELPGPQPTATPMPGVTPTATLPVPTPNATPSPTSEPLPGNVVVNGSYEGGWTDMPPAPGNLINQQPNGWQLSWLAIGQPLWDDPGTIVQGVPESLHKLADQLPPDEKPGGSRPLILDGIAVYKMFHYGAPFGSQLHQVVRNLPPGTNWRLTVPMQVHVHGDDDPWGAESGVWALTSASQTGGWTPGGDMGDHEWFYHVLEFTVPADGRVEIVIRVKSKWFRAKDFFVDAVELRRLAALVLEPGTDQRPTVTGNSVRWGPRDLHTLPPDELIVP